MKYKFHIFLVVILVGVAFSFSSCQKEETCLLSKDVTLTLGMYAIIKDSVEVDTTIAVLSAIGVGLNDSLYSSAQEVSFVRLQLNPYQDETKYYLKFGNKGSDTLSITSKRTLKLLSETCGFITNYQVLKATSSSNYIDSVYVINTNVTNETTEHVKIYF